MPALYQRLRLLPLAAVLTVPGCFGEAPEPAPPTSAPRIWPLAVHLAARSYDPIGIDDRGSLVAQETGIDGGRPLRFEPRHAPVAIQPPGSGPARALAVIADGGVVVESAAGQLTLFDRSGLGRRFGNGERWLGAGRDGRKLWTARAAPGLEELVERSLPALGVLVLLSTPPGFRIATVSDDGVRVALVRTLHDEADEVVLADRSNGERRLLLPSGPDGRFRPLLFAPDGDRLLLLADDGGDLPRLEWLEIATGERFAALETPCGVLGARGSGAGLIAELACDGRREVVTLEGPVPWAGHLAVGTRALAAVAGDARSWWLAWGGVSSERDLVLLPESRIAQPLTWGLPPRLEPGTLPTPEPRRLVSGGLELPAELWRSATAPTRAGLVWFEEGDGVPDWGRFDPFLCALASRGVAVLRLRGRGSDGFGRALRRGADGDPVAASLADLEAAARHLRALEGLAAAPLGLVGAGPWTGAIAAAQAAAPDSTFTAVVALDPEADPLSPLDRIATAPEPLRSALIQRWGDPARARGSAELRARLVEPATSCLRPLLVLLDVADATTPARRTVLEAAATAGRPLTVRVGPRPAFASGPGSNALWATWDHLLPALVPER